MYNVTHSLLQCHKAIKNLFPLLYGPNISISFLIWQMIKAWVKNLLLIRQWFVTKTFIATNIQKSFSVFIYTATGGIGQDILLFTFNYAYRCKDIIQAELNGKKLLEFFVGLAADYSLLLSEGYTDMT